MIPVCWYEGVNGLEKRSRYGIATLLNEAFDGARAFEFRHQDTMDDTEGGAVVVLHGEHLRTRLDAIKTSLEALPWALVVIIGDEGSVFHSERLIASNRILWQQMPVPGRHDFAKRKLICGYPHDTQMHLVNYDVTKVDRPHNWFFSGQVNHIRRRQCVESLKQRSDGVLIETPGFWQGLDHSEYFRKMADSKLVICPAGCSTPDTMRVAEALEAGCLPIVDARHHRVGYPDGYWNYTLGEQPPFPLVQEWKNSQEIIDQALHEWPANRDRCIEWWKQYKRNHVKWLEEDLWELTHK